MNPAPQTIGTLCEFIKNELTGLYHEREITGLTEMLFNNLLKIPGHEIHLKRENHINIDRSKKITEIVNELKSFKPIQYILGHADFYGLRFKVTPDVLIPRPETEELVKWIIDETVSGKLTILDIGTGCGCIAIVLKLHLPAADVFGSDISDTALKVAQENAESLQTEITFFNQDILNQPTGKRQKASGIDQHVQGFGQQTSGNRQQVIDSRQQTTGSGVKIFDIIVSNPPYIPEREKSSMNKNVTDWEPRESLFVPDKDPLIFYRNIAVFGLQHLRNNGKIYLEIHEKHRKDVKKLFTEFDYSDIVIRKDINGKDRMIRCLF